LFPILKSQRQIFTRRKQLSEENFEEIVNDSGDSEFNDESSQSYDSEMPSENI
jgi:hypothetical protein